MPRYFSLVLRSLTLCFGLLFGLHLSAGRAMAQPTEKPPRLVTGRFGMPAVAVGTDIYVLGGLGPTGFRPDIERIDTASQPWKVSVLTPKILPRYFHSAEASGPFLFIFGGLSKADGAISYSTTVERFDTRDDSVQLMAPMPLGLRAPASVLIDDKIYVAGGADEAGERVDALLIYDIAKNAWKTGASMLEKKECDLIAWHGGLLAIGGFDGTDTVAGVESYDIAADTWKTLPPLPTPTSAHHSAAISDDSVVIFGDYADPGRVQIGNPEIGDWKRVGGSGFQPRRHGAVVPIGSKIYVIGGNVASVGSFLDNIQVFEAQKLVDSAK